MPKRNSNSNKTVKTTSELFQNLLLLCHVIDFLTLTPINLVEDDLFNYGYMHFYKQLILSTKKGIFGNYYYVNRLFRKATCMSLTNFIVPLVPMLCFCHSALSKYLFEF